MLRRLISSFKNIIYPQICLACKNKLTEENINLFICPECFKSLKKNTPPFFSPPEKKFDRAFAPYVYDGAIKELIHEFKYNGKDYLGKPLSKLLIEFINDYDLPLNYIDFIVPIPLHSARLREREFNQAEVLSRHIAREFGMKLSSGLLKRHRHTKNQAELDLDKRLTNVKNSFLVTKPEDVLEKNILLVDDVLTTGATASEAAEVLKESGANIIFVLAIAN